jgi:hypothetical protein
MSFLGLFLFKDVISLGVSFYLISYFGRKATPFGGAPLRMPTLPVPVLRRSFFLPIPLEVLDQQRRR